MKKIVLTFIIGLISIFQSVAQADDIDMADGMRAEGKIYVVIAIIAVILAGLFIYLISIDRKVKRLENRKS